VDNLHTTKEAGERLGISASRVRQLAYDLGLGRKIGRDLFVSDVEIEQMRQRRTTRGPVPRIEKRPHSEE
jgi:hypothetical protein